MGFLVTEFVSFEYFFAQRTAFLSIKFVNIECGGAHYRMTPNSLKKSGCCATDLIGLGLHQLSEGRGNVFVLPYF